MKIIPITPNPDGSYTGTGTYGSSNLNSLTFDFVPKYVIILGGVQEAYNNIYNKNVQSYFWPLYNYCLIGEITLQKEGIIFNTNNISLSEKTINWYNNTTQGSDPGINNARASEQLNSSGQTYNYIAFG